MKNFLSLLIISLLLSVTASAAANYTDVAEDAWYAENISKTDSLGIMQGYEDMSFKPDKYVKLSEVIALSVRIHPGFTEANLTASTGEWYLPYVDYAIKNGIVADGDFFDYNAEATRAEVVYIMHNASTKNLERLYDLRWIPGLSETHKYYNEIKAFYEAGYLSGVNKLGNCDTERRMTRAELATIAIRNILHEDLQDNSYLGNSFDTAVTIDGIATTLSSPAKLRNGKVLVPFADMASALNLSYSCKNGTHKAYTRTRSLSVTPENKVYMLHVEQICQIVPELINGKLYIAAELFAKAFHLENTLNIEGSTPILHIRKAYTENHELNNTYINGTWLGSETSYLIWISKSEYTVRLFRGERGNWKQINSFVCSIGAPNTPTCEGTYKYYQAQKKWDFGSYYVGPIMRFNGGYALHSTLFHKNGTLKDDRVGMMLSHGCIRLHPKDINWLFANVPLRTTIHITG